MWLSYLVPLIVKLSKNPVQINALNNLQLSQSNEIKSVYITLSEKQLNKTCLPEANATQIDVISLKFCTVVIKGTTAQAYL